MSERSFRWINSKRPVDAGRKIDLASQIQSRFAAAATNGCAVHGNELHAEVEVAVLHHMQGEGRIHIAAKGQFGCTNLSSVMGRAAFIRRDGFIKFQVSRNNAEGRPNPDLQPHITINIPEQRRPQPDQVQVHVQGPRARDGCRRGFVSQLGGMVVNGRADSTRSSVVRPGWHDNSARVERKHGAVEITLYGLVVCDLDGKQAEAKFPSKACAIPAIDIPAVGQVKSYEYLIAFA